MTLYPNIIYHSDTETIVFLDSLQRIGNSRSAEITQYNSSSDGKLKTFNSSNGNRGMVLTGKISTDNESTIRRQLDYLLGKQVYIMMGAENLATLGKINSYDFQKQVGTYTPVVMNISCDGDTEGQFYEAEDCAHNGTAVDRTFASGGTCVFLNEGAERVPIIITQDVFGLPIGNYTMFARAYDANNVTDDFGLQVYNSTDAAFVSVETFTLTSAYEDFKIITSDFSISSEEAGDSLFIRARKETTTSNVIYVDFLGFVRTD